MTENKRREPSTAWMGLAGIGIEFGAAVAGFALLGWWIDRKFDSSPIALLICAGLGLLGGSYNLIRQSLAAARRAEREDADRTRDRKEDERTQ